MVPPANNGPAAASVAAVDGKVNSKAPFWAGPDGFVQYEEDVQVLRGDASMETYLATMALALA